MDCNLNSLRGLYRGVVWGRLRGILGVHILEDLEGTAAGLDGSIGCFVPVLAECGVQRGQF